jgi:hypothetical protein
MYLRLSASVSSTVHTPQKNLNAASETIAFHVSNAQGTKRGTFQVINAIKFVPCPSYESCTPSSRTIYVGDDSADMPFIPFADDETFAHLSLINEHYDSFSWQYHEVWDPDREHRLHCPSFSHFTGVVQAVAVETAKRLQRRGIPISRVELAGPHAVVKEASHWFQRM